MIEYLLFPFTLGATYFACVVAVSRLPEAQAPLGAACVVTSALALSALFEKLLPRREEWSKSRGDAGSDFLQTNFALPLFTKLTEVGVAFGVVALTSRAPSLRFVHELWPSTWSFGVQMCLALAVTDLGFYVGHRLCHAVPWLWKFHAHHHASKRVYILNSGKFHPVDIAVQTLFYTAPLIVVGATPRFLAIFVAFSAVHGLFEHGNFRYRVGPFDYLFNTNGLHQWHHSLKREEANSNYGKVLSIYDWMFGTRRAPAGVSVGDVGISEPVAERYLSQLLLKRPR